MPRGKSRSPTKTRAPSRAAPTARQRRLVHSTTRTGARRAALLRRTLAGRPKQMSVEFEDLGAEEPRPLAAPLPAAS